MRNIDNYQDIRKQINLYFDNELCGEDCQNLLSKVEADPRCNSIFNKEKSFRDYVRNNIKRPSVSTNLIQAIKNKITP